MDVAAAGPQLFSATSRFGTISLIRGWAHSAQPHHTQSSSRVSQTTLPSLESCQICELALHSSQEERQVENTDMVLGKVKL